MICMALVSVGLLALWPEAALAAEEAGDFVTNLSSLVAVLIVLSVASERLVEIVKGLLPPLNQPRENPFWEGVRKSFLQLLAVGSGVFTAWATQSAIRQVFPDVGSPAGIIALGLLASGGSGFWNSLNTYVLELKNVQKELARQARRGLPPRG